MADHIVLHTEQKNWRETIIDNYKHTGTPHHTHGRAEPAEKATLVPVNHPLESRFFQDTCTAYDYTIQLVILPRDTRRLS